MQPTVDPLGVLCDPGIFMLIHHVTAVSILCRYAVPAERASAFQAALQQQHGPDAVSQLTAKHLYCALPMQLLKKLGVRRFLQMPGYAVLTYPVSFLPYPPLVEGRLSLHVL